MDGDILLQGAKVFADNSLCNADILIRDGVVLDVSKNLTPSEGTEVIKSDGFLLCPGFVDLHVHFREPGFTAKETILTGSSAAAHGGYTTVCTMPNLNPVPDSVENLEVELQAIRRDAVIDVRPYCSITRGRQGREIVDMEALKDRCVAFSDDGSGVQDSGTMLAAMRMAADLDCIIAAHCEDNSLLRGGYIHDGAYCAAHGHKGICSESEWGQIARDLELCAKTGCRYHVCHISTFESVELIRQAKASGVRVTCETGPHYLLLCDDDMLEEGRFKMNPPLRSSEDRDALIEGLNDGTIDVIATDHAPHTEEEKSRGLKGSAMGIVGLETSFPELYTGLVKTGKLSFERLLDAMCTRPRAIFPIGGGLFPGAPADIVALDTEERYVIDSVQFLSKGRSTPFDGDAVFGKAAFTMKDGRIVHMGGKIIR